MLDLITKVPTWAMMLPLYFLWILTLAVVAERYIFFYRRRIVPEFFFKLSQVLEKNEKNVLISFLKEEKNPAANALGKAMDYTIRDSNENGRFSRFMQMSGSDEIALLERHLSVLGTVATIAPLFGLLGTVTGLLKSFQFLAGGSLGQVSVQQASIMASGISEALVTTFAGLVVAIPAYIFYNFFINRINFVSRDMEKAMVLVQESLQLIKSQDSYTNKHRI